MRKSDPDTIDTARGIAINALGFLTGDTARLARFLDVTGWTPASLASPDSRLAILLAGLDYLMGEEDLLLTFAANSGLDPLEVGRAYRVLTGGHGGARGTGD